MCITRENSSKFSEKKFRDKLNVKEKDHIGKYFFEV